MGKPRKNHTADEKVAILKRYLVEKTPVSDLCDELGLNPTVFYNWQKLFFENGAAALAQCATASQKQCFSGQFRPALLPRSSGTLSVTVPRS